MNFIALSKDSPDIAKAIEGCEVGVPKTLTITVTPTADTDSMLLATVDSAEYTEEVEDPGEDAPITNAEQPYKPKPKKDSATAVY